MDADAGRRRELLTAFVAVRHLHDTIALSPVDALTDKHWASLAKLRDRVEPLLPRLKLEEDAFKDILVKANAKRRKRKKRKEQLADLDLAVIEDQLKRIYVTDDNLPSTSGLVDLSILGHALFPLRFAIRALIRQIPVETDTEEVNVVAAEEGLDLEEGTDDRVAAEEGSGVETGDYEGAAEDYTADAVEIKAESGELKGPEVTGDTIAEDSEEHDVDTGDGPGESAGGKKKKKKRKKKKPAAKASGDEAVEEILTADASSKHFGVISYLRAQKADDHAAQEYSVWREEYIQLLLLTEMGFGDDPNRTDFSLGRRIAAALAAVRVHLRARPGEYLSKHPIAILACLSLDLDSDLLFISDKPDVGASIAVTAANHFFKTLSQRKDDSMIKLCAVRQGRVMHQRNLVPTVLVGTGRGREMDYIEYLSILCDQLLHTGLAPQDAEEVATMRRTFLKRLIAIPYGDGNFEDAEIYGSKLAAFEKHQFEKAGTLANLRLMVQTITFHAMIVEKVAGLRDAVVYMESVIPVYAAALERCASEDERRSILGDQAQFLKELDERRRKMLKAAI